MLLGPFIWPPLWYWGLLLGPHYGIGGTKLIPHYRIGGPKLCPYYADRRLKTDDIFLYTEVYSKSY